MPVITIGRMCPEDIRPNKSGDKRWVKGTVHLYGPCASLLSKIRQRKLPFTITTGQVIPKEPVILMGEITEYPIPGTSIRWKTLNVEKFIAQGSAAFEELGVTFREAVRLVAGNDKNFLEKLGSMELKLRERLIELVGSKNKFADHMIELFKDQAVKELENNPWKMIHIVPYFTMEQADKVAKKLGIPLDDKRRFYEYFRYLLDQSFESHRNTYISEAEFIAFYWMHFSDSMGLEEYKKLAGNKESPIIRTGIGYHPAHLFFAEKASYDIIMKSLSIKIPGTETEEAITGQVLLESPLELTKEQVHAVRHAFRTPLHVITGGPGTGKTTVLNAVLKKLVLLTGADPNNEYAPFLLVAPTGKAAYRMWEQTGIAAHTAHSAFGIIPEYGCLNVEETAKRLSHVRYLVIDESSMLDTKLFGDICRVLLSMDHIPFLLLVGDADQLRPVQHGQVFCDILEFLGRYEPNHVTRLTVLKRQEDGSSIPELAAYIKEGEFPGRAWFQDKSDVFLVEPSMEQFQNVLVHGVLEPKQDAIDAIQILTPYRNGNTPDTIYAINALVEPLYNKGTDETGGDGPQITGSSAADGHVPQITCGKPPQTFRVGDKVINRMNRTKTIINGSIGHITAINDTPRDIFAWTMDVMFEDGQEETYIYEEFKSLELAYAITIHASQGSEYEDVVLCVLRGNVNREFLNQNLFYVGVTRAVKRLVLIGQGSTFAQIAATKAIPRKTALRHWLMGSKEGK